MSYALLFVAYIYKKTTTYAYVFVIIIIRV